MTIWLIGWLITIGVSEVLNSDRSGWRKFLFQGLLLMKWPFYIGRLIGESVKGEDKSHE